MKKCTKCGVEKPLSEFHKHKSGKNGIRAQCKNCRYPPRKKKTPEETKHYIKSTAFERRWGFPIEHFNTMLEKQKHKCLICNKIFENSKKSHLDHCHTTGIIRGILCTNCNIGLGHFRDNIDLLKSAVKYLKKYNAKTLGN